MLEFLGLDWKESELVDYNRVLCERANQFIVNARDKNRLADLFAVFILVIYNSSVSNVFL